MQRGFVGAGSFGASAGIFGYPVDGLTAATPMAVMRGGQATNLWDLILGLRMGSLGEGAPILIILAAIYLIATKTANWRLIASTILSALF